MSKKKLEVIELNKKKDKIVLAEEQSPILLFFRRHGVLIYLTSLIVSLTIIAVSMITIIKNINISEKPTIKETSIDVSLDDYEVAVGNNSLTEDYAKDKFLNSGNTKYRGEVILVNKIEKSKYKIYYYSDGTALKITGDNVIRINPLSNGKYGIENNGVISSSASIKETKITDTKEFAWGTVKYLADGSAIVEKAKIDIFVRDASDIKDNYISNNKVTYLKETKNVGNSKVNYYFDGTIEVVRNGKSYIVRNNSDVDITENNVTFKNDNQAEIYKTLKTDDGYTIDYYTDGGAIIRNGSKTISVRKSNSIIIKDNKIYEIVDNIYVDISKKDGDITYYTNGSAVIDNYNGKTIYVPENSDIKYKNDSISNIDGNIENLVSKTTIDDENVLKFEETAVIKIDDTIKIVPSDSVIYDADGKVKEIGITEIDPTKGFDITNNTNELINYRVVLEESSRTSVNTEYLRYQLTTKNKYVGPTKLNSVIWADDDIKKELNVTGRNYILVDGSIEAYDTESINLMLWTDYDTIPNSEQNKYFYGTIKVYAWTEIKK